MSENKKYAEVKNTERKAAEEHTEKDTQNMTEGSPAGLIFRFAIPVMLGNMFQQVYIMTDTAIVGRAIGMDALAALGSVDWYNYMVLSVIQALTQGFGIRIAQEFGAERPEELKKAHAHSIVLSAAAMALLLLFTQTTLPLMLTLLRVPAEIRPMSSMYMRVLFAGIPAQMLFNYCATALRSLGNSRSPLHAMLAASGLNIVLDLLFVLVFHMGVGGAAFATILSQLVSGIWVLVAMRRISYLAVEKRHYDKVPGLNMSLLRLSTPMVMQNALISAGGMVVTAVINGLGVIFLAGYSATTKWYCVLEMAAIAYSYAVVTYMGQNYGAGKVERIHSGYRASLLIAGVTSAIIGAFMFIFARPFTSMLMSGDPARVEAALKIAVHYMHIAAGCLPLLYLLYVTRATLQGIGDTVMTMISGIAELIVRLFMSLVAIRWMGGDAVLWGEVFAWIGADFVLCGALFKHFRSPELSLDNSGARSSR